MTRRPPRSTRTTTLLPYTTLFRSMAQAALPDLDVSTGALAKADFGRLMDESELGLIRLLASWPRTVESAAEAHEPHRIRSEEHTSELQSLMRISYAVVCLKQKKHIQKDIPVE